MYSTAYNLWTYTWFVHFELPFRLKGTEKNHTERFSKFPSNIYSILYGWGTWKPGYAGGGGNLTPPPSKPHVWCPNITNDTSLESSTFRIWKQICKFAKMNFFAKSSYIVICLQTKFVRKKINYAFFKGPLTMLFQICKKFCKILNILMCNSEKLTEIVSKQRFSLLQEKSSFSGSVPDDSCS